MGLFGNRRKKREQEATRLNRGSSTRRSRNTRDNDSTDQSTVHAAILASLVHDSTDRSSHHHNPSSDTHSSHGGGSSHHSTHDSGSGYHSRGSYDSGGGGGYDSGSSSSSDGGGGGGGD
jgi:hypothetical protein